MSDLLFPDSLDARLDRATIELRADDPVAIERIVARTGPRPTSAVRPATVRLRYAAGALTVLLAGAALWPRGEAGRAQAAMPFARVQAATRLAPRSIARNYDRNGKPTGYTIWREGTKYASELWTGDHKRLLSETRSDGRRKLFSFQWEDRAKAPGYRFASLGPPTIDYDAQFDTLDGVLRTYIAKGREPVPERVGTRLRYRIRPIWAKKETMTVEADAKTGRVLEIRSPGSRTILDYDTPIRPEIFRPRVSAPDIVVLDGPKLERELRADITAGLGAWHTGDGMLWRVYRGDPAHPPAISGLRLSGRIVSKSLQKDGVVAVGSKLDRTPPAKVRMGGKALPVRKIGMIYWQRRLFGATTP